MRVLLNAAMTADGKIALRGGHPLSISDPEDLRRVHGLRTSCDAILVGIGTVLADDPQLTARTTPTSARQPVRVILDSEGRLPTTARVLDGAARTVIFTAKGKGKKWANAETIEAGEERVDLRLALRELSARGVQTLLVEGGATVFGAFLSAGIVDEMTIYIAPMVVGGGAPSLVEGAGAEKVDHLLKLKLLEARPQGAGVLLRYGPAHR